jgi:cytochrome c
MKGTFSMRCSLIAVALLLVHGVAVDAQGPTFNLGTTPTEEELRPADAAVGPDGEGLPQGRGTARVGVMTYLARGCAKCHGSTGTEGPGPELVGPQGEYDGIASYPFATMIWSYINQMMPLDLQMQHAKLGFIGGRRPAIGGILYEPCCLKPDEVYALTAYLLYRNDIVGEDDVLDADSLPDVQMPLRGSYLPPPFLDTTWKPGMRQAEVDEPDN